MHNNTSSHLPKKTNEYEKKIVFKNFKRLACLPKLQFTLVEHFKEEDLHW